MTEKEKYYRRLNEQRDRDERAARKAAKDEKDSRDWDWGGYGED